MTRTQNTLHECRCTYIDNASLNSSWNEKRFRQTCTENQNSRAALSKIFPKIVPFIRQCGKTLQSRTGHRWQYNTAHAHCIVDNLRLQTYLLTYVLTYLTYSMVQSPSWEANWFAASQEILRISRNPKVHYGTQKRPPTVSILGQPNPVHIHTSHLLEIRPNIIHTPTPRSPQWSPSLRLFWCQ